jgi:hypothetical protein
MGYGIRVIARESGRVSNPGNAAEYRILAFVGMTCRGGEFSTSLAKPGPKSLLGRLDITGERRADVARQH